RNRHATYGAVVNPSESFACLYVAHPAEMPFAGYDHSGDRFLSGRFGSMNTGSDGRRATAAPGKESGAERALGSRAPAFVRARRALHIGWQVGVFVIGLAVIAAGVILLPLPGPGWLVIFAGMAIWATEFVWAQLVLLWTKRKVTEAA